MSNKYIDICTDLETWGTRAGYDARSIGACVFDPHTWTVAGVPWVKQCFPENHEDLDPSLWYYAATDNPLTGWYSPNHHTSMELDMIDGGYRRYNLRRDPKTVQWWHDPERAEAAATAFANPIDLRAALIGFTSFIHSHSKDIRNGQARDVRVWGHGAAFDPPYLEALFHAVGLEVPWYYRAPRDTRTCFDMAGIAEHSPQLEKYRYGIFHHALHDTISESLAICDAYNLTVAHGGNPI